MSVTKDEYLIKVRTEGTKKAQTQLKGVSGAGKQLKTDFSSMLGTIGRTATAIGGATVAFSALQTSINKFARFEGIKTGFDNLTDSMGFQGDVLQQLKNATDNTVDSLELMELANNAMLLGINDSSEQMAEMFDIAQRLAKAVGQDARFGVESLVTGLGRQSKLMLDNLGIVFDTNKAYDEYAKTLGISAKELDDNQRKQAFVNTAMEQAKELANSLGEETISTSEAIAQLRVNASEMGIAFGELFAPVVDVSAKTLSFLAKQLLTTIDAVKDFDKETDATIQTTSTFAEEIEDSLTKLDGLTLGQINAELKRFGFIQDDVSGALKNLNENTNLNASQEKVFAETMKLATEEGNNLEFSVTSLNDAVENGVTVNLAYIEALKLARIEQQNFLDSLKAPKESEFVPDKESLLDGIKQIRELRVTEFDAMTTQERELAEQHTQKLARLDALQMQSNARKVSSLVGALGQLAGTNKKNAKTQKRLAQAEAIINTYASANVALKSAPPPFNFIAMAGVIAQGLANVAQIEAQQLATGTNQVVTSPKLFIAGEAGAERVNVTPLARGGGDISSGININISGGLVSQDFIENELSGAIRQAIKRGTDIV